MIRVPRPDLDDPTWRAWSQQADAARQALEDLYGAAGDILLEEQHYQDAKPFLLSLFHQKCAYCETVISASHPGDVEHYRPKGRIRTKAGVVTITIEGRKLAHPGYWWLAYQWKNLLPSCIDCNRRRQHQEEVTAGKADYFEIRGERASTPRDNLDAEHPLLLDPTSDDFDPAVHLQFNADGTLKPMTEEAVYSCELLGLNLRETLVRERSKAFVQAKAALVTFMNLVAAAAVSPEPPPLLNVIREQINDMWEGRSAYSGFTRAALEACRDQVRRNTQMTIPLPLPYASRRRGGRSAGRRERSRPLGGARNILARCVRAEFPTHVRQQLYQSGLRGSAQAKGWMDVFPSPSVVHRTHRDGALTVPD